MSAMRDAVPDVSLPFARLDLELDLADPLGSGRSPRRKETAADLKAPGPPPRLCFGSERKEEVPNLLNRGRVALGRTTRKASEKREHLILHRGVEEQRVTALEISLLRLISELPVLDRAAPLSAPRPCDVNPVGHVDAARLVLVYRGAPEDERERQDQPGRCLIDHGQLVAQAVLDVVAVNGIVHDLERRVCPARDRTSIWVHHDEAPPFVRRQCVENAVELLRVLLESVQRLLARQLAEVERVIVQRCP